ncbi:MAG: coproporphyrinogen III oxidase family protein, partial [Chloroflexi bacterium]|nr:coproporphyrinogen III oxidase family protein [Chloroflexota bacterium]
NPNNLDVGYCSELLAAGVNRLSIGAQTLDRRGLRVLGRLHEADQVDSAVRAARNAGFENLSLDLIYGWPGQTIERWRSDLSQVLTGEIGSSPPDHLSLYGLIVEPGTPMADAVHRGILAPIDNDTAADFFELAAATLTGAGWLHYEIANWAATSETASRHNAVYWRNGEYAGIGAGAHGHSKGRRTMNQPSPKRYTALLERGESPVTNVEQIDGATAMAETMMLGLRLLTDGVSKAAFEARHGISIENQFDPQIAKFTDLGLLEADGRSVRLTPRGALIANSVCAEFL